MDISLEMSKNWFEFSLGTTHATMLTHWDFTDAAANSTSQQINRQKSARNLVVRELDRSTPRGVFYDRHRKETHIATLSTCDCHDFNFAGDGHWRTFRPCMHIYRLAIELGLVDVIYLDWRARAAWAGPLAELETKRLQRLPRDPSQWGGWAAEVHESGIQQNRQYRAYSIVREEQHSVLQTPDGYLVHDYAVDLSRCTCADFSERRLPCKHVYAVALTFGISLPFDYDSYQKAHSEGPRGCV